MSAFVPAPQPRAGSGGCWKWGALTCGGCGCVVVIAVVAMLVMFMGKDGGELRRFARKMVAMSSQVPVVKQDMEDIRSALEVYRREKGKWPDDLKALVPHYLPESRLAPRGIADAHPYMYHLPTADAGPNFVVVETLIDDRLAPMWLSLPLKGDISARTVAPDQHRGTRSQPDALPATTPKPKAAPGDG